MTQKQIKKIIMKNLSKISENNLIDEQIANVTPDPPKKTKADLQEQLVLKYMEEYGITNPYIQSAMMGIILNEGGFAGKPENLYYTTAGRLAEVWSTFSNYKDSKGRKARAPEGQGKKYANELAKSGKYLKNPKGLANFIYATQKGNRPNTDDGYVYRGRGLNQLTGRGSYKSLGEDLGVDLLTNPELLDTDPDLRAKAAVHFLHKRLTKELPYLTQTYSRYKKRFGNYVDINNIDNLKDASFILTSANAGFGSYPKQKAFNDRLAAAKKYETKYIQPEEERWQDEFEIEPDVLAQEVKDFKEKEVKEEEETLNAVETNKVAQEQLATATNPEIATKTSSASKRIPTYTKVYDQKEIPFVDNSIQNFSKKELEKQKQFNKSLATPIMNSSAVPQFGQGVLFGTNRKKYGGNMYPSRKLEPGGPLNYTVSGMEEEGSTDPMKFMVDAETGNLKTYNFDTGKFEVSDTAFEGDTTGMMSHISDIYDQDDQSFEAAAARAKKADDLAKWSAERTKGAQDQIAERSIRNLGKKTWEQGSPYKYFLDSIGGARCITGSSCNLSPTPGDSDEPNVENLARVPYYVKDKRGNYVPNKPYKKASRQKVGVSPSVEEQNAAPKGGVPGGPIPVVTGNQSFASRYKHFGMEMQKQGVFPQPGDIQVLHGFEEKEWKPYDLNNIQRGDTDTGYWRRKKNPDGSPVFTNGRFVYGLPGNSNHAQTIGPYLTSEVADDIEKTDNYYYGDYSADPTKLTRSDNPGSGSFGYVGMVDPNKPTYKGTATMRYKGSDPMFQKIAEDAAIREMETFDKSPIQKLDIKRPERIGNDYSAITELPSEFLKRIKNRPYATGGNLNSNPCPSGQIYDPTSKSCVSYEAWEKNNSGFNIEDVKKENEDYYKANEWFEQYHNSPKYYEMTRSSFPEGGVGDLQASILRKRREQNLKTTPPLQILEQPNPGTGGLSYTGTGQIEIFPEGFDVGTGTHEISHSSDRPIYFNPNSQVEEQRIMPVSDSNYINKRKADVLGDSREYFNNKSFYDWMIKNDPKQFKEVEKEFLDFSNYVGEDTETRARLNTIRQIAQEQGIYDPFTEGVSPDTYYKKLKKLKFKNPNSKKRGYNPMKQLQDTFSDEEIIWMLNNISENKTNNSNDAEGMA